jgi:hypothetical protein
MLSCSSKREEQAFSVIKVLDGTLYEQHFFIFQTHQSQVKEFYNLSNFLKTEQSKEGNTRLTIDGCY